MSWKWDIVEEHKGNFRPPVRMLPKRTHLGGHQDSSNHSGTLGNPRPRRTTLSRHTHVWTSPGKSFSSTRNENNT
jgi:hypothetical protein